MLKSSLSRKTLPAWVVLVAGLLATVFASVQVKQGVEQEAVRQFAFACDQISLEVRERLNAYALILRGGAALFAASRVVERNDWRAYVETLRAEGSVPGVQGIGFAQVIAPSELASHVARIRGEGFPAYTVNPAGERALYTSIIYLEPFRDRNLRAFGYDMFSEPVRRAAMEQARDSGEAALSGKVELVQETGIDVQAGTLMYVPVYRNGMPKATPGQRRAALIGWAYSPYRMNDLMLGILGDWKNHEGQGVDVHIFDGLQTTPATLLYDSKTGNAPEVRSLLHQQRTIDFNGHQWLLEFDHTSATPGVRYAPAWATLTGGLTLSGLLFWLMLSMSNTRADAERIANQLTEEIRGREEVAQAASHYARSLIEASLDPLVTISPAGKITDVNQATEKSTGHSRLELIGADFCDYFTEPDKARAGYQHVFAEGFVTDYPLVLRHRDGHVTDVLYNASVYRNQAGAVLGVFAAARDITEQKRAEGARSQLAAIVESSSDAIIGKTLDGIITSWNKGAEKIYGYRADEIIGKPITTLVPSSLRAEADGLLEKVRKGEDVVNHESERIRKDGKRIHVALTLSPIKDDAGNISGISTIARDITERKLDEAALHRLNRELRAISNCNQTLMRAEDEQTLLNEICQIVCDEAGYRMAWVGYAENDEAKTVRPVAWAGFDSGYVENAQISWADDTERGQGPAGMAIRSGKIFYGQDFANEPEVALWGKDALARGYRSSIALPLKDESAKVFGVLLIYSTEINAFVLDEIRLLEELAGDLGFGITVLRTRNERKKVEEELRRYRDHLEELVQERTADLVLARNAAETANRAKSVFLSSMSHELRTPLNAILGFSNMMRKDPLLQDEQRQNLDIINRSGEHLLTLINDVLEMAKIEAGRVQVESAPFDLGSLVRDVTDMMHVRAQEKGLQLLIDQSSEFPRYIKGDEARVRQVLINLLGNAVKFTRHGGVTVRFGLKPHATPPRLLIEVEDSGIGISAPDQKRVFEPFVQFGETAAQQGTGLGLSIARQFVQLMGGAISFESTLGTGSTFRVELPMERVASADVAKPESTVKGEIVGLAPGQPEYRILIVEDQLDNQLLLAKLMKNVGLQVKMAENGEQAVGLFQSWRPQLIWMDRRMPVMDGLEATRRIRELPGGRAVKIVAVTASAFMEQRGEMLEAGMDDIVRKPYRFNEIYECMAKQLGVQYSYAEAAEVQEVSDVVLTAAMMAVLPANLHRELHDALESLEDERITTVIGKVASFDSKLHKTLSRLADNFDYPAILKALQTNPPGTVT